MAYTSKTQVFNNFRYCPTGLFHHQQVQIVLGYTYVSIVLHIDGSCKQAINMLTLAGFGRPSAGFIDDTHVNLVQLV